MGEKCAEAKITYLPIHSGDGYGYGGGTILTIGDLSFNFGESPKAKAIAERIVLAVNSHDTLVEALKAAKVVIEMMERPLGMGDEVNAALDARCAKIDAALSRHGEGK